MVSKADKNKVTAITKMPVLHKQEVNAQSIISMANYLSKFLLDCQRLQSPSDCLVKDTGTFQLGSRASVCLYTDEDIEIASAPILADLQP